MTTNMGTPMYPEGMPHWTGKSLFGRELRKSLEEDRAVMVGYFEKCDKCDQFQREVPAPTFENLLNGVVAVGVEEDYGNYRPDIILHRRDAPPRIIEIVDTSEPNSEKLAFYKEQGADVFRADVHTREDVLALAYSRSLRLLDGVLVNDCRQTQRARLQSMMRDLCTIPDASFGVKQMGSRLFEDVLAKIDPESAREHMETIERNKEYFESDGVRGWSSHAEINLSLEESDKVNAAMRQPLTQQFLVAGKTVTRDELLSVISMVRIIAQELPEKHFRESVIHQLFQMQATIRHQNGRDHEPSNAPTKLVDLPIEDELLYESVRNSYDDVFLCYESVFFPQRYRARFLMEAL
ncbi:MAG: hypothetical protein F4Y44_00470 [Chloroflexi bacterium]|nr:hypothetical protein [Chloroflexota bacterium]